MRMFLSGNDAAYNELEGRARASCIRFRNQEMPPGCSPKFADIGFEVTEYSSRLLVTRGVHYEGSNHEIRDWYSIGEKIFPSFDSLKSWIRGPLAEAFNSPVVTPAADPAPIMTGVISQLQERPQGIHVNNGRITGNGMQQMS